MGQPIHTLKRVFNSLQFNSPSDNSEVTHVTNVTNVFKDLEDWGSICFKSAIR